MWKFGNTGVVFYDVFLAVFRPQDLVKNLKIKKIEEKNGRVTTGVRKNIHNERNHGRVMVDLKDKIHNVLCHSMLFSDKQKKKKQWFFQGENPKIG